MCGEAFSSTRYTNPQPASTSASGDHDAARLSREQLERFVNAFLNNRPDELERTRREIAPASLAPAKPKTKAEAAEAVVAFLTDASGQHGNPGEFLDVGEDNHEDSVLTIDYYEGELDFLTSLVRAYQSAAS
jgi:hypothetical protein